MTGQGAKASSSYVYAVRTFEKSASRKTGLGKEGATRRLGTIRTSVAQYVSQGEWSVQEEFERVVAGIKDRLPCQRQFTDHLGIRAGVRVDKSP